MWDGSWGGGTCQSWLADIKVKYWVQLRVELFYNKPLLKGISAQKLHPRYRWQVEIFFSLISFISHFIFSVYLSIYRNLCGKKWAKCNKMQFFYTFRNNWIKFEYFWKRSIKVGDFVHDALAGNTLNTSGFYEMIFPIVHNKILRDTFGNIPRPFIWYVTSQHHDNFIFWGHRGGRMEAKVWVGGW